MKKRRRAYKKYDWKTHKLINEALNRTYYPFSEFFNWYAETFGDAFKDIADNFDNYLHEIAKIQEEW